MYISKILLFVIYIYIYIPRIPLLAGFEAKEHFKLRIPGINSVYHFLRLVTQLRLESQIYPIYPSLRYSYEGRKFITSQNMKWKANSHSKHLNPDGELHLSMLVSVALRATPTCFFFYLCIRCKLSKMTNPWDIFFYSSITLEILLEKQFTDYFSTV